MIDADESESNMHENTYMNSGLTRMNTKIMTQASGKSRLKSLMPMIAQIDGGAWNRMSNR